MSTHKKTIEKRGETNQIQMNSVIRPASRTLRLCAASIITLTFIQTLNPGIPSVFAQGKPPGKAISDEYSTPIKLQKGLLAAGKLIQTNKYSEALAICNKIIASHPDFYPVYSFRAMAFSNLERPEEAIKDFDTFVKGGGKLDQTTLDNRSRCYSDLGQWDKSLADIDKAIAIDPLPYRYRTKGEIYLQQKKDTLAMPCFKKALEIAPTDYWSCRDLATCYTSLKMYPEALKECNRLIKLRPGEPNGYALRARVYEKMGKADLAKKDMEQTNQKSDFPF